MWDMFTNLFVCVCTRNRFLQFSLLSLHYSYSIQAYQAHLIGKNHKKRVQQLERTKGVTETTSNPFKCDVCEIFCSNHDAFQAHVKGAKHLKTVNLFRKLGKPLPTMTSSVNLEGGGVTVSAPRITFVGGKKLSSTGMTISNNDEDSVQVYPPGAPQPAVKESKWVWLIIGVDCVRQ